MAAPVLATKLFIPPPRPRLVDRPRLSQRLGQALAGAASVTLISAPAGFGKTTLLAEWIQAQPAPVAWLSLDENDNDPPRFLTYLIAALQTVAPGLGQGLLGVLQTPQPPPAEAILTALLNEMAAAPGRLVLVLDDYHAIEAPGVDQALTFLIEHLPPAVRLILATRADPPLPLARLRARGQLAELRAADLRFTSAEAAEFLNRVMGLNLSPAEVAALEARTEGWIAGLQLAALSLQGQPDTAAYIRQFTGSHHFVLDYLVEEVLHQQPASIQRFLLETSMLDRLCGPLCDAVLLAPAGTGQATLEYIERANLFSVPLDGERRWYRYHHLFGSLLRQRLRQRLAAAGDTEQGLNALHLRASQWYEDNGLDIEAFRHAAAAHDVDRAERLADGKRLPLHLQGAVTLVLDWLAGLPESVLKSRPKLLWQHGAMLLVAGRTQGVAEKLQAAEDALAGYAGPLDDNLLFLLGGIAAAWAVLALTRYDAETMLAQSRRALEYLPATRRSLRANAYWTLGYGHFVRGERAEAGQAYAEAIALSQAAGDVFTSILATIGAANVQEADLQLPRAAETYRRVLALAGEPPQQIIHEAHLGLARAHYEWNELDDAERHGRQALWLAGQYERGIDRFVLCQVFLARARLARGDVPGAAALLAEAEQSARQHNFVLRQPEVAAAQVVVLLRQGKVSAAGELAETYDLPLSQARVRLAQGDAPGALAALAPWRQHTQARGWADELLKTLVLEALGLHAQGERDRAVQRLGEALTLARTGGCVRTFADEGAPMAALLAEAIAQGAQADDCSRMLAVVQAEAQRAAAPLIEPLSARELKVLRLIAEGLSNDEISRRLFLALSTVKGHNQRIFDKLQVQRRTEAVARARELGLL